MARVELAGADVVFLGTIGADDDLAKAAWIATTCTSYRRDDEDEDPLDGAVSCFGCRYRRWVPGGFTCTKGLLPLADEPLGSKP